MGNSSLATPIARSPLEEFSAVYVLCSNYKKVFQNFSTIHLTTFSSS